MSKYSLLGGEDIIENLRVDANLNKAVENKKKQKSIGDRYIDLQEDMFKFQKDQMEAEAVAQEQAAMSEGIMGAAQSGVQTAFGSQSQDQALGGALMTGLQTGLATGNPYIGAAAAGISLLFGSRAAKKAEEKEEKARLEAERKAKLQNMRKALSDAGAARQTAMSNLMNVLSR